MTEDEENRIDDAICEIMMNYGPDGHIDGHERLTAFVVQEIMAEREACAKLVHDSGNEKGEVTHVGSPPEATSGSNDRLGTCGTCKFKGEEIEKWDDDADDGNGDMVKTGFFQCQRIKHDPEYAYLQGEGAVVTDGSGYLGKLCVESEFGCVKWDAPSEGS